MDLDGKNDIRLKFIIDLITFIILFISWWMVYVLIKQYSENVITIENLFKNFYIFIIPCGIDGLRNLLTKRNGYISKALDTIDLLLGIFGGIISIYLFVEIFIVEALIPINITIFLLCVYPLRYLVFALCNLIKVIELRNGDC